MSKKQKYQKSKFLKWYEFCQWQIESKTQIDIKNSCDILKYKKRLIAKSSTEIY